MVCGSPEFCTNGEGNLPFTASLEERSRCAPSKADRHQGVRHDLPHGITHPRREIQTTLVDKVLVVHRPAAITPIRSVYSFRGKNDRERAEVRHTAARWAACDRRNATDSPNKSSRVRHVIKGPCEKHSIGGAARRHFLSAISQDVGGYAE